MNVNGKYAMIFHNEKDGKTWFNLSDSSKNVDGTYTNQSYSVRFAKETEPPRDRSKINFKGFTSYYKPEDKVYTTIQVMEWEYSEQTEQKPYEPTPIKEEKEEDSFFASSSTVEIDEDMLPF